MHVFDRGLAYRIELVPGAESTDAYWHAIGNFAIAFHRIPNTVPDAFQIVGTAKSDRRLLSSAYYAARHETWFEDFQSGRAERLAAEEAADLALDDDEEAELQFLLAALGPAAVVGHGWFDVSTMR